ncbi:TRAP transporter 4TM/12TM fusion protein [Hasllibacter halocynthiae]|uniref:TRAP transporter 4TM/12TM fusion protein n=1 Tax=Hasllibacter halocynthiae TaxID=595589 RepID=A0A2T0WZG8_9RHOB|nr:TRAP transporter fused permease subunit [Hasllibacter halocynthiae]PRY92035.1 TRAP transporter 4TM/12TM fusion protein [Hasllibacter halocynthiae]
MTGNAREGAAAIAPNDGDTVPETPLGGPVVAEGVDEEPVESNRRLFAGWAFWVVAAMAALYALFHMAALNGWSIRAWTGVDLPLLPTFPMETWNFRIVHVAGALVLGFVLYAARTFGQPEEGPERARASRHPLDLLAWAALLPALYACWTAIGFAGDIAGGAMWNGIDEGIRTAEIWHYGVPLVAATALGIAIGWARPRARDAIPPADLVLGVCALGVAIYLVTIYGTLMRNSTGTPFAPIGISLAALAGTALIMELTRRVAGLALIVIAGVFLLYVFVGDMLPGFLNAPDIAWERFFSQVYTDAGILGPTTAVSSTYIILFIIFAAFLQASKVGDYFVNFAFAAAGRARGGPAKVAIFASGLMGMINGTSAGNVVATGSLTIPLMKKVGYRPTTSGAVEAAASTGGQIMPPIMGAGAFIMAEITGIPYTDIAVAAIIPAILYFVSIYFMVDFEAAKLGMRGMREDELPRFRDMARRVFLFLPIVILIAALFMGYSVIRAGTLATVAAAVVSWVQPTRVGYAVTLALLAVLGAAVFLPGLAEMATGGAGATVLVGAAVAAAAFWAFRYRGPGMGPAKVARAFESAGYMSIQIIAVCACAGIIVGVISLTGVGARFSSVLLGIADANQLLALFFAMCIAILLGMGMPTTAAYAVAASVVAPGLVQMGIPMLTAHFFVFYFAVVSAITPPVALASYAAAGISGSNPMSTSVASFKIGISAFIVPFMFFYNSAILMDGTWLEVLRAGATAVFGVFLLSSGVQGWWSGDRANPVIRAALVVVALFMIEGGVVTDLIGVGGAAALFFLARAGRPRREEEPAV